MDMFIPLALLAFAAYALRAKDQRRRIALLASHLGKHQIEKLMETLTQGYLRALGESEPARREQIWQLLSGTETQLIEQFNAFAAGFARVAEPDARVSKIALAFPYADKLFPRASFDMRQAFAIHAQAISDAAGNRAGRTPRDKAFTLSAELFLMQHSCHWFCKSKTIASARLLARHQTSYAQVLAAVAPETRLAYGALVGH